MIPDIELLPTDELKNLFTKETSRLMVGLNNGLPFYSLKEIRLDICAIEVELEKREETMK